MRRRTDFYGNEQYSGEIDNDRMNSWKGEQASPADTYIEWCFEQKCKQLSNGFGIITEWRIRKQQYVQITGTTIFDFQHYSRHDATHSIAILETIELLLGKKRVDMLSAGDLWLLLEAAYSHDAGMAMNYDEVLKLWTEDVEFQEYIRACIDDDFEDVSKAALYYKEADNLLRNRGKMENLQNQEEIFFERDWPVLSQKYILILVTEYIRKKHAARVVRLYEDVECNKETVVPPRLYRMAAMVCQMHGRSFHDIFEKLKYSTKGFGSGTIHPQFVSAMLRIGDLLDIDNNRFNPYAIEHFGRLPLSSLLHLKKHKAITDIRISESEINIEAHTDQYEVGLLTNNWFQMIDEEVRNLICNWNIIVPEALIGCTLQQSRCRVYLLGKSGETYQAFDAQMQKEFTINKKKLINLLVGTSIYDGDMDFLREYIQNAIDASKMQLWIDLENGRYDHLRNPNIVDWKDITPFDLDSSIYQNYRIQIFVEWNSQNDKIRIKISDQGIGIEEDYLKNLSNIGTGWKGRTGYKGELKRMMKWLQPTGGFGIGVQSAFMVTDTVEILTKSEKNLNGYKITLKSPDKVGSVTAEEIIGFNKRGTTVMIDLVPEKFQDWARYMNKHSTKEKQPSFEEIKRRFGRDRWDEFDPEAILFCATNIIYHSVKNVVLNPLFPIEISSPIMKSLWYWNSYLELTDYWRKESKCMMKEIGNSEATYQCMFIPQDSVDDPIAVIWDKQNCIFHKISLRVSCWNIEQQICFKNILVRNVDTRRIERYQIFNILVDFMGFPAENCLKIHRNSFSEKFSLEHYCREGLRILIQFLKTIYESDSTGIVRDCLNSYEMQLICLMDFYELYDAKILGNTEGECSVVCLDFQTDEKIRLQVSVKEKLIKKNDIIQYLEEFYRTSRAYSENSELNNSRGVLLALKKEREYSFDRCKVEENRIHPNKIIKWISSGEVDDGDESDLKKALDLTKTGIGLIADFYTVRVLLSDDRFEKKCFILPGENNYYFVLLYNKLSPEEMPLESIYAYFWCEKGDIGRKFVRCNKNDAYKCLLVDVMPYQDEEIEKGDAFLISPISNNAYRNVIAYKDQEKNLDYNKFRELVWGKKGQESMDYHMLIEWVVKHQLEDLHTGREDVIEAYERLLKNIYQERVNNI